MCTHVGVHMKVSACEGVHVKVCACEGVCM